MAFRFFGVIALARADSEEVFAAPFNPFDPKEKCYPVCTELPVPDGYNPSEIGFKCSGPNQFGQSIQSFTATECAEECDSSNKCVAFNIRENDGSHCQLHSSCAIEVDDGRQYNIRRLLSTIFSKRCSQYQCPEGYSIKNAAYAYRGHCLDAYDCPGGYSTKTAPLGQANCCEVKTTEKVPSPAVQLDETEGAYDENEHGEAKSTRLLDNEVVRGVAYGLVGAAVATVTIMSLNKKKELSEPLQESAQMLISLDARQT